MRTIGTACTWTTGPLLLIVLLHIYCFSSLTWQPTHTCLLALLVLTIPWNHLVRNHVHFPITHCLYVMPSLYSIFLYLHPLTTDTLFHGSTGILMQSTPSSNSIRFNSSHRARTVKFGNCVTVSVLLTRCSRNILHVNSAYAIVVTSHSDPTSYNHPHTSLTSRRARNWANNKPKPHGEI